MCETKICIICNKDLSIDNFSLDKRYNTYNNQCIKCKYEISKPRIIKNKEKIARKKQEWVDNNRERVKANQEKWHENNLEYREKYQKSYYNANRDKILENNKKYNNENKEKVRVRKSEWTKQQRLTNPQLRVKDSMRARVRGLLTRDNITKKNTTQELIGCDFEYLRKHLESQFTEGMTWENYGRNGWHVDHIIPCNNFDLTDIEQQKKCFHYTNLQPLWEFDNLSKGSKI